MLEPGNIARRTLAAISFVSGDSVIRIVVVIRVVPRRQVVNVDLPSTCRSVVMAVARMRRHRNIVSFLRRRRRPSRRFIFAASEAALRKRYDT